MTRGVRPFERKGVRHFPTPPGENCALEACNPWRELQVHAVPPPEAEGKLLGHGNTAGQAGVGDCYLTQDMTTTETHAAAQVTIGTRTNRQHDAPEALAAHLHVLPATTYETHRTPLGRYCGRRLGLVEPPQGHLH